MAQTGEDIGVAIGEGMGEECSRLCPTCSAPPQSLRMHSPSGCERSAVIRSPVEGVSEQIGEQITVASH